MSQELAPTGLLDRLRESPVVEPVLNKYREGETAISIAAWLQEELMEFPEADPRDLQAAVKALYVERTPLEERLELSAMNRSALRKSVATQKTHMSTYEELQELFLLQKARLDQLHGGELDNERFNGGFSHEIEVARRLAMNMHEVEQDLGVRPGQTQGGGAPGGGMSSSVKQKLGKVFKKILDEAEREEQQPVDVQVVDDAEDAEFQPVEGEE